jgi:hypothetical protein
VIQRIGLLLKDCLLQLEIFNQEKKLLLTMQQVKHTTAVFKIAFVVPKIAENKLVQMIGKEKASKKNTKIIFHHTYNN